MPLFGTLALTSLKAGERGQWGGLPQRAHRTMTVAKCRYKGTDIDFDESKINKLEVLGQIIDDYYLFYEFTFELWSICVIELCPFSIHQFYFGCLNESN